MRLLLLEDDDILGEVLCRHLRQTGHVVDRCSSLAQSDALRGEPYDALPGAAAATRPRPSC